MCAIFVGAFFLLAPYQVAQAQGNEYVWKEAGVAARMPGTPVQARNGITLDDYEIKSTGGDERYMLVYEPMSGKYVDDAKWQFDRIEGNFVRAHVRDYTNTLVTKTDIILDGNPGREIRIRWKANKRLMVLRTYWVKLPLRLLTAVADVDDSSAEPRVAAFLNSLRLLKP